MFSILDMRRHSGSLSRIHNKLFPDVTPEEEERNELKEKLEQLKEEYLAMLHEIGAWYDTTKIPHPAIWIKMKQSEKLYPKPNGNNHGVLTTSLYDFSKKMYVLKR